jgi:hypothetical protein
MLTDAGSYAPLERHIAFFEHPLPEGLTTGCSGTQFTCFTGTKVQILTLQHYAGSCGSDGWRGRTSFIDSGAFFFSYKKNIFVSNITSVAHVYQSYGLQ